MPLMPDPADWSYSGDPNASDRDQVRFWLQDTDPNVRLLSNTELQFIIDTWKDRYDSLIYAASKAADAVSVKFAGVVSVNADGVSVDVASLSERFAAAADRLMQTYKDAQVGGEVDIRNLLWGSTLDHGIAPLRFGMGLHDNREAGLQDYGGMSTNPWQQAEDIARYGG